MPIVISGGGVTEMRERTLAELRKLAKAEIRVGILSSADGELLRIARVHEFGATIKPKTAKNLAIPLRPELRDVSPRSISNTWIYKTDDGLRYIVRSTGKGAFEMLYMLVPKVTIPERSFIQAGYDAGKSILAQTCEEAVIVVAAGKLDAMTACHSIGRDAVEIVRAYIRKMPDTRANVTKQSLPDGAKVLRITGRLYDAITYEVVGI